jgi:SEC-C motif domain protein
LENCHCCSQKSFQDCCKPFIDGDQKPLTCLQLMRSRYSAYVIQNADYLLSTTHLSKRNNYSKSEILDWATTNQWQKLEIINSSETTVEFKANYLDFSKKPSVHHELSVFKLESGRWFYVDGSYI